MCSSGQVGLQPFTRTVGRRYGHPKHSKWARAGKRSGLTQVKDRPGADGKKAAVEARSMPP